MKREWTNKIRFILDEFVPPLIRDSKWFMWPFFVMAYGKCSVNDLMNFKSRAYSMTTEEYARFYGSLGNSVSRRRLTDLNAASLSYLLRNVPRRPLLSVLDVGAGNGYLLRQLASLQAWSRVAGVDVVPSEKVSAEFDMYQGALPRVPFADKEFDVVTCTHVMEHVLDPSASARELIRITKNKLFVVVPRQRYYYYTLDEHLNFYPRVEPLVNLFSPFKTDVVIQDGDWVLTVNIK